MFFKKSDHLKGIYIILKGEVEFYFKKYDKLIPIMTFKV